MPCRSLPFLAVALLSTVAPARAQAVDPAPFFALTPGNEWEYTYTEATAVAPDSLSEPVVTGYVSLTALRDTVVDGEPRVAYTITEYGPAREVLGAYRCTAWIDDVDGEGGPDYHLDYRIVDGEEWPSGMIYCAVGNVPGVGGYIRLGEVGEGATVSVGAETYSVPATARAEQEWGCNRRYTCTYAYEYASGLGLYRHVLNGCALVSDGAGGQRDECYEVRATLTSARIAPTTPREGGPDAPPSLSIKTFPNPSPGAVRVAVEGRASGPAVVEVYDVAGRLVEAVADVQREATVDLGALPAGVYVVRARDASGASALARVVLVE